MRTKINKKCLNCDNIILRRSIQKWCSTYCHKQFRWKTTKAKISEANYIIGKNSRQARRYFIEVYGYQCVICKNIEWLDITLPLVLDHIDGHSDNWKLDNLRMICCNCDAQLPTYKSKNRGNGRFSRRERYKNGQSY